jgi:hypothetical protein
MFVLTHKFPKHTAGGRIRTYEGQSPPDLQSGPLDRSGTPAKLLRSSIAFFELYKLGDCEVIVK